MPHETLRICHAVLTNHGSLLATLFIGGLVGGATHCVGMCGPFVLSQTATALDETPLRQVSDMTRLRGAALLPYHAGRATTYAVLGVLASMLSAQFRMQPWFADLAAVLLALAGAVFLISAFPFLRAIVPAADVKVPVWFSAALRQLFSQPRGWRGYALGVALGMLPCGLVYAALLSVAAKGDPLTALWGMLVFALGTVPALVIVGVGGQFAFQRFRQALRFAFPVLMMMNSLTLFAMAGDLVR